MTQPKSLIGELGGAMLTVMMAKFMLNDMPHAAGLVPEDELSGWARERNETRQNYVNALRNDVSTKMAEINFLGVNQDTPERYGRYMYQRGRQDTIKEVQRMLRWSKEDIKELISYVQKGQSE